MKRISVFSVIYPGNLPFFDEFLGSLASQTDLDFSLVLAVDAVQDIEQYLRPYQDQFEIHHRAFTGSIAKIRMNGFQWLMTLPFDQVVFADTDDVMATDRVAVCRAALSAAPVVVNDVVRFETFLPTDEKGYWSNRLANGVSFSYREILTSNFAGLGNSAVEKSLLENVTVPENTMAVDWMLFGRLMSRYEGVFLHDGKVFYRQHGTNMVGVKKLSLDRLKMILSVKMNHYQALGGLYPELTAEMRKMSVLHENMLNVDYINEKIQLINNLPLNYFWWEEPDYMI